MATTDPDIPFHGILVPGLHGSNDRHWQSRWQQHMPWLRRIQLDDWTCPDPGLWQAALDRAAADLDEPAVLIAHSYGCLASAAWARRHPRRVTGLLLVAPAWPGDQARPLPPAPLPVPARVVASVTDPWLSIDQARDLARQWGAAFRNGGDLGHINATAGIGDWRRGLDDLRWLLAQRRALAG